MKQVDWGLLRIQYEIFGEEIDDLAEEYDTTPRMIEYAAEEGKWQRMPIAKAISEWQNIENLEEIPPDLMDQVRDRMQILFTLKQSTLNPKYIAIETAILGKAQQVIQNLSSDHPNAAQILKAMTDVFTSLREATGAGGSRGEETQDNSIKVQILQRVGPGGPADPSAAVQVEVQGVQRSTPAQERLSAG